MRLENLPLNNQNKFGDMATKVFNNKEEEVKKEREKSRDCGRDMKEGHSSFQFLVTRLNKSQLN